MKKAAPTRQEAERALTHRPTALFRDTVMDGVMRESRAANDPALPSGTRYRRAIAGAIACSRMLDAHGDALEVLVSFERDEHNGGVRVEYSVASRDEANLVTHESLASRIAFHRRFRRRKHITTDER